MTENRFDKLQDWGIDLPVALMYHPDDDTLEVWDGCTRVHKPVPREREKYIKAWAKGYCEGKTNDV